MAETFEYAIKKDVRNNPIVREVDRDRHREMWRSAGAGRVPRGGAALLGVAALRAAAPRLPPRADAARARGRGNRDQPSPAAGARHAAISAAHRAAGDRSSPHGGARPGRGVGHRACPAGGAAAALGRRAAAESRTSEGGRAGGRKARIPLAPDAEAAARSWPRSRWWPGRRPSKRGWSICRSAATPTSPRAPNASSSRTVETTAKRGDILDRDGRVLAYSVDADSIYAVPTEISDPDAAAESAVRRARGLRTARARRTGRPDPPRPRVRRTCAARSRRTRRAASRPSSSKASGS